jgi:hypothetical protein
MVSTTCTSIRSGTDGCGIGLLSIRLEGFLRRSVVVVSHAVLPFQGQYIVCTIAPSSCEIGRSPEPRPMPTWKRRRKAISSIRSIRKELENDMRHARIYDVLRNRELEIGLEL